MSAATVRFKVTKPCFIGGVLRGFGDIVDAPAALEGDALQRLDAPAGSPDPAPPLAGPPRPVPVGGKRDPRFPPPAES